MIHFASSCDEMCIRDRATNAQTIELTPALVLEHGKTFKRGYRNVIVVKKMTFPNDKLLTIEMTEQQISGRNISLNIEMCIRDSPHTGQLHPREPEKRPRQPL